MNTSNWSRDLGIFGAVADLGNILPAIAFGIGLTFGFSFDTAGPRREPVEVREDEDVRTRPVSDADEPLTADRGPYAGPPTVPVADLHGDTERDTHRHPVTTTDGDRQER
jgi:hypothetical protein